MASSEEGGTPFTFNFFQGTGPPAAAAASPAAAEKAAAAASDPDPDDDDAAAEAATAARAEAEADALLAGAYGGSLGATKTATGGVTFTSSAAANADGSPGEVAYLETAEELEGPSMHAAAAAAAVAAHGSPSGVGEVRLVGTDVALAKCTVSSEAAAALLGESQLQASDLVPGKYEGGSLLAAR
jgi:hypothetical protein